MIQKTILFTLLLCSQLLCSQNWIFKEFGMNDGLPSLQVYDICQDRNGIIWFATDRGLANYNGYEFKKYGVQDGILNNVVLDFYPQKNGDIYCTTLDNKIFYFNEKSNKFIPYKFNKILEQQLEYKNHIVSLYIDDQDNLNLGCDLMFGKLIISKKGNIIEKPTKRIANKEIGVRLKLEKKKNDISFFYYTIGTIESDKNSVNFKVKIPNNNGAIALKGCKHVVFKTHDTVSVVNEKGAIITTIKTDKNPIVLKVIDETHFFIGYSFGGGVITDINGNIIERFLDNLSVTDFLIDNEGGYWFSTLHSGVFYSKEPEIKFISTSIKAPINALAKNKNNELYIGYDTGDVLKLDAQQKLSIEYKSDTNFKAFVEFDSIRDHLYIHSGNVFYRKGENNEKENLEDSITTSYTLKLSEPTKNGMLISHLYYCSVINNKERKHIKMPFRVHDTCFWDNEIYFGTPLGVYLLKNEEITSLGELNPLFKNRVDDIDFNEKKGEIYFATLGAGIIIYDKKTEKIRTITKENGLSSDIINELHLENENELWVCTNSGLNKIKFLADGNYEITGLKSSNGLLNDGIRDVEIINDTVWIASRKGLIHAPKKMFDKKIASNSYYFKIKECYVNDSVVELKKLKNLSYEENRVEFLIEGISFKESSELLYKYKLEGFDDKWYYTKHRQILYTALPYGNYTIKVAVTTSENAIDLQFLEIPICIKAPFWKQVWFVISSILSILVLIYLFFKYRILSYNRDIIRELLRLLIKKIKRNEKYFSFKDANKEIRIKTDTILYVKSSGNYIEIITENKNYTVRIKIKEFISLTPDPLEYLRIHRSYIIRIDKVTEKNNKGVTINGEKLPVSNSYATNLNNLIF